MFMGIGLVVRGALLGLCDRASDAARQPALREGTTAACDHVVIFLPGLASRQRSVIISDGWRPRRGSALLAYTETRAHVARLAAFGAMGRLRPYTMNQLTS